MTHDEIMNLLNLEYQERRAANQEIYEGRVREACEKCPGLENVLAERLSGLTGGIRKSLLSRGEEKTDYAAYMKELNARIAEKLKEGNLPADFLKPVYTCPECKDEGYVYDPSRRMCGCMKKRMTILLVENSEFIRKGHCFENFDLNLFSPERNETGLSQRKLMSRQKEICEAFADKWPDVSPRNLLLTGKTGLGKTYLLECIAHRLAERGILPAYTTAYRYLEAARRAQFENEPQPLAGMMNAEILILDDLGTEPLMNNITAESVFTLINERGLKGKTTLISTNLNENDLRGRYSERVSSRLLDPSAWGKLQFIGEDVRRKAGRSE